MQRIEDLLRKSYYARMARYRLLKTRMCLLGDRSEIRRKYRRRFGREPNLDTPRLLSEKIQWLKLNRRESFYSTVADKYAARDWLAERFGEEYLVPLLFITDDWRDITSKNIPDEPCIVKCSGNSGTYQIIRDKSAVDWKSLRSRCRLALNTNFYYYSQEWQYKDIKPLIIVEQLLQTEDGLIPNDYKLQYFNGQLGFVYCSIDRENANYRKIYSPDWEPLPFQWGGDNVRLDEYMAAPNIEPPATYGKMLEIGGAIARLFEFVRIDFFDVEGRLYCGEITLHHGGGLDRFVPESYDEYWGDRLELSFAGGPHALDALQTGDGL